MSTDTLFNDLGLELLFDLLHAYLADFLNNTPARPANRDLISLLEMALHASSARDRKGVRAALVRAAKQADSTVLDGEAHTTEDQQERDRIELAASVACALLALAARFSPATGQHLTH